MWIANSLSAIDNYLLLHMTDFMTTHSLVCLAMTSQRFLEPMIQVRLHERIDDSIFVELEDVVQYPTSLLRDATHTHLEFAFDAPVQKRDITFHTISWIFNWRSIASSAYVWDYTVVDGETICHIKCEFANIAMYMEFDDDIDEYVITRIGFSHLTHIKRATQIQHVRKMIFHGTWSSVAISFVLCDIYREPSDERLIMWFARLFCIGIIYYITSPFPSSSPVISRVAT